MPDNISSEIIYLTWIISTFVPCPRYLAGRYKISIKSCISSTEISKDCLGSCILITKLRWKLQLTPSRHKTFAYHISHLPSFLGTIYPWKPVPCQGPSVSLQDMHEASRTTKGKRQMHLHLHVLYLEAALGGNRAYSATAVA